MSLWERLLFQPALLPTIEWVLCRCLRLYDSGTTQFLSLGSQGIDSTNPPPTLKMREKRKTPSNERQSKKVSTDFAFELSDRLVKPNTGKILTGPVHRSYCLQMKPLNLPWCLVETCGFIKLYLYSGEQLPCLVAMFLDHTSTS